MGRIPNAQHYFSSVGQAKDVVCSGSLSNSEWCWTAQCISCSLVNVWLQSVPSWLKSSFASWANRSFFQQMQQEMCYFCFHDIPLVVSQESEGALLQWERDIWDISTSQFWLSCHKNVKFKLWGLVQQREFWYAEEKDARNTNGFLQLHDSAGFCILGQGASVGI